MQCIPCNIVVFVILNIDISVDFYVVPMDSPPPRGGHHGDSLFPLCVVRFAAMVSQESPLSLRRNEGVATNGRTME